MFASALLAGVPLNPGTPWPARDGLGRELPLSAEVGPPKADRFVGIFYFLWQSAEVRAGTPGGDPYNVASILARDPAALEKPASPLWGPVGVYHYWAEPLLGYYANTDPWVISRHAQWLADAGVDTLIFDTTNAQTYPDAYLSLCSAFEKVRRNGGRTPQLCFMVHTAAGKTADKLFREFYGPGCHRDLWFHWQGKPLLLCDPAEASSEVREFFTLRRAHWPFTLTNTHRAWHWEATYPQPYGYADDPAVPEQVNISVAQNLRQEDGKVTNMGDGNARGRSFHNGRQDASPAAVARGLNFQEQWQRAFELNPPFVMVTGWNEWIAGRWGKPEGPIVFVDQYDQEFSRDIEPMRGGHGDNYYLQLIANIRRYKGVPELPSSSPMKSIELGKGFDQWEDVRPVFADAPEDTAGRQHRGVLQLQYTNHSGRNDIVLCQVARDSRNLYFHARTREPLTPPRDNGWMWLLLNPISAAADATSTSPKIPWEGYEYVINRRMAAPGEAWLERHRGGWTWESVARIKFRAEEAHLHLAVPLSALGLDEHSPSLTVDFKWIDNAEEPPDIHQFYTRGDVAPEGRLRFRYQAGPVGAAD